MSRIYSLVSLMLACLPLNAPAQGIAKTDFNRLAPKVTRTLNGHTKAIRCLAFSPDGQSVASGASDGRCVVWNMKSGEVVYTIETKSEAVMAVAFSPDGKLLATGDKTNHLKLWDSNSGKLKQSLEGHTSTRWVHNLPGLVSTDMLEATPVILPQRQHASSVSNWEDEVDFGVAPLASQFHVKSIRADGMNRNRQSRKLFRVDHHTVGVHRPVSDNSIVKNLDFFQ